MYSVVGCPECEAITVVADRPETTTCPRCRKRLRFETLRVIYQSDDPDDAREIRGRLLAERSGHSDAFGDVDSFATLESRVEDAGMSPDTYREKAGGGTDSPTPADARTDTRSGSQTERVRAVVRSLDEPTRTSIVERAGEDGLDEATVETILEKLRRHGEATRTDGVYRLL